VDSYDSGGYLVFVWSPQGYVLQTRPGDPPPVGAEIESDERRYRVTKVSPSPLPGDGRVCAYLQPA
jgi:hypothetical protein